MNNIQDLTEKLYTEGVQKGKNEAERIISTAKKEEAGIIENARKEAEQIIELAKKEAKALQENSKSELKLYASQALEGLKTEIVNLVTDKLSSSNVKVAVEDKAFMQALIVELVTNWNKNESLTIGTEKAEELTKYIQGNAKHLINNELKIESVNGIKTGFVLMPQDGSYKIQFGEAEFVEYFKEYLRPQIQKLLF